MSQLLQIRRNFSAPTVKKRGHIILSYWITLWMSIRDFDIGFSGAINADCARPNFLLTDFLRGTVVISSPFLQGKFMYLQENGGTRNGGVI